MGSIFMHLVTPPMAACQLGHITILLARSMGHQKMRPAMLVILEMSQLEKMVLLMSMLLTVRFHLLDQIQSLAEPLLYMPILMILERVVMNSARPLETLVAELLAASSDFKAEAGLALHVPAGGPTDLKTLSSVLSYNNHLISAHDFGVPFCRPMNSVVLKA